jgi:hypothetical protein
MSGATALMCGVMTTCGIVAAVFAFLGAGGQAYASLRQIKEFDPYAPGVFVAVDDLNNEFSAWRQPVRRSLQRSEVRQLLKDSPEEARLYPKVMWQLGSWSLLTVASLLRIVAAVSQSRAASPRGRTGTARHGVFSRDSGSSTATSPSLRASPALVRACR